MPEPRSYPKCFGPYLRYAISTDFRNFEFFDERSFSLLLLVELHRADKADEFEKKLAKFDAALGPQFGKEFHVGSLRYVTLRASKAAILHLDAAAIWDEYVSKVELSLPVKPSDVPSFRRTRTITPRFEGAKKLLIGVLDDGCPFAAAQFLTTLANQNVGTRVRGIWDQNRDRMAAMVGGSRKFGEEPPDFKYGLEYRRDLPTASAMNQVGINEWINLHSMPSRVIDENGCYADAGFTTLARRESHGAHVMDVFAGRIPPSSRIGPPTERRDPPNWTPGTGPASTADVVFVQFSDACIRDATGVWLKAYVVEGIDYIMSFADPNVTENVVINLSYGPTTGPHDGTHELEEALTELVTRFDSAQGKPKLEIVLAAGNAYLSEGHFLFARPTVQDPDHVEWIWRLPPDNSVLCFAEIWVETATDGNAQVTLTPPSGLPVYLPTPPPASPPPPGTLLPPAGVDVPLVQGNSTMWRLHVESTINPPEPGAEAETAEHGDWRIKITGIGLNARVHAYVARSDPNMGVRSKAKRSYFVDHAWEPRYSAEAGFKYYDGEFDKTGSLIRRLGTLNGIATGSHASVHVAGGFMLSNRRKSPYSSAGPARNWPPSPARIGPDYALPCDETYALAGIRGGGNRSGVALRLTGTSVAAPQLARYVADDATLNARDQPNSDNEKHKRGKGNLDAP